MKKRFIFFCAALLTGCTPSLPSADQRLFNAARTGNTQTVKILVQKGTNPNGTCQKCWTPVMIAVAEGHEDTARVLLENGADPNAQNQYGRTALHFAVNYGFEPIVKLLLAYNADPTKETFQNFHPEGGEPRTPVQAALRACTNDIPNAYAILKILVEKSKDVNASFEGNTPLAQAEKMKDTKFIEYLLQNGAARSTVKPEAK